MASLRIPDKPICILFSHGGQVFIPKAPEPTAAAAPLSALSLVAGLSTPATSISQCEFRTTTIPANCQLVSFVEPGTLLNGNVLLIHRFCRTRGIRKPSLEPVFLWHSVSELSPKRAKYIEYADPPIVFPYTNSGLSIFESPKRAGGGALVADTRLSFQARMSEMTEAFGLYVHFPNGDLRILRPSEFATPDTPFSLSKLFTFLQGQDDIWNPEVGVALMLISCQNYMYEKGRALSNTNLWIVPQLAEECDALESLQEKANIEYQSVELYDRGQLAREYPEIQMPVFFDATSRARGSKSKVLNKISETLLNFANRNIKPENISSANRTKMRRWIEQRKIFLDHLTSLTTLTSEKKQTRLAMWLKANPMPPNPVEEGRRTRKGEHRRRSKTRKQRKA